MNRTSTMLSRGSEERPNFFISIRDYRRTFSRARLIALRFEQLEGRHLLTINLLGVPNWVEQGPAQESQQLYGNSSTPPNDPVSGLRWKASRSTRATRRK